jgi:crotonobetainyl-CoA:carnitine CoA-transferase CaiB-like acyl-CoA transferase
MVAESSKVRPLSGLKVLDLSQILAGPYCTRLLADAGADVTKIEPPTGDPSRNLPSYIGENHSGYFLWLNCGKKSVIADLRTEEGRGLVRALASEADVLVENMRPGSLNDKGLGYSDLRELNPGLVMCSISAFGNTGVFAGRAGQGIVAEGWAGSIDMNGDADGAPLPLGVSLADVSAGIHAYGAILTALYRRDHVDGVGDYIDLSLFEAALPFHETALEEVELGDGRVSPTRNGAEHRSVVPYGVFDAPDGYLVIAAGTERLWSRLAPLLAGVLGESDLDLSTNALRLEHRAEVKARIEEWARSLGTRDQALAALAAAGIPSGPIQQVRDVAHGELAVSRGSFVSIPDPILGHVSVLNTPYRTSTSRVGPAGPAPRLGEHTGQVIATLAIGN